MRYLICLFGLWVTPAFAQCPDPQLGGDPFQTSGPALISPQSWSIRAEGLAEIPCATWDITGIDTGEVRGYLPVAPTAVFELSDMGPHILMVMAQADCGPALVARTADGLWYFGETNGSRQDITIWGAPNAPLQVWVGSETQEGCDGVVTLETFDR